MNHSSTLATAVGQRLVDRGVQLGATDGEQVSYQGTAGIGGSLKIVSLGASTTRSESDSRDSRLDLAVEYGREIIERTRVDAVKDYEAVNGVGSASHESSREALLLDWASDIRTKMQDLEKQALEQTKAPKTGHDVDPYPEQRLPPPPNTIWRGSPK